MSIAEDVYRAPLAQIVADCTSQARNGYCQSTNYTFADGSILWIDQLGRREAYLRNGWNVTPKLNETGSLRES